MAFFPDLDLGVFLSSNGDFVHYALYSILWHIIDEFTGIPTIPWIERYFNPLAGTSRALIFLSADMDLSRSQYFRNPLLGSRL
jgi:hypothetical protein